MAERIRVLVADDDRAIRIVIAEALGGAGFEVECVASAGELRGLVAAGAGDVVVTDVLMPDGNGLDLLPEIAALRPGLPVIVMSAQNTLVTAVRATEGGAFDYLAKPFDLDELERLVREAASARGDDQAPPVEPDSAALPLVGRSPAMQALYRSMARLMATDLTVLISGESGTGKELVARALHAMGQRAGGPFVAVNMAAIPRDLIESELFGHEKGAFTGATARAIGRFAQADGGTLFLDEIGDMPLEAQTRLLRVLQEGEFTSVGGARPLRVDVRIIAASNRELAAAVARGHFREDLFYRLNVVPLEVPPLRRRLADIPDLVSRFLARAAAEGLPAKSIDREALALLARHRWPGNVRELENLVLRLCALVPEERIGAASVRRALGEAGTAPPPEGMQESLAAIVERQLARYFAAHGDALPPNGLHDRVMREVERPLLRLAMAATRGNQLRAAALLGINRNTLRKKLREHDLDGARGKA